MMNSKVLKTVYYCCLLSILGMIVVGSYLCATVNLDRVSIVYIRNMSIDALGMLVATVLVVGMIFENKKERRNQAMFCMDYGLVVLFFLDIVTSVLENNAEYILGIKLVNTIAFITEDILGICFWVYIKNELKLNGKIWKIVDKICIVALYITVALDILNWKFGYMFTVSAAGEYIDSDFEFVGDLAIVVVLATSLAAILQAKDRSHNERFVLLSFGIFPTIAYMIGSLTQEYLWIEPAYLLSVMLIYIRIFTTRAKKLAEQKVMLNKQSTALMISQIQPHFLYNVLTTISNLCVTDPEEAEETTVLFSQYLRTNLDSLRNDEPVPFSVELGHIRTYVELEKKRFGDILNVEYAISAQGFNVPSLGLQPIVENSIKHGIRGKNAPGHIKISSSKVASGYEVIIEDDGIGFDMNQPPKEDGRSHVGMTNVKERLRQMVNATMTVESSPGNGCKTTIFIPEN